ncbi:MAG: high-affinity zinc transporter periplasmic component [Deltaproteobacteria bacterium ADurb.Bin510]|nr:MAG: high-affinity zinc transporter periplasmic component [Deltaproteobacteria bacterium ADurb.Bin510]
MQLLKKLLLTLTATLLLSGAASPALPIRDAAAPSPCVIVASDTLLAGMVADLLPPSRYRVTALLPPGQCPGHYDLKLSDIEKVNRADLVVGLRGLPFMSAINLDGRKYLLIDTHGHNWMAPAAYLAGLEIMAAELSARFPQERSAIQNNKNLTAKRVSLAALRLRQRLETAKISHKSVIASAMQKEPLEDLGLRVVATYGRPESISAREIVRLSQVGQRQHIIAVVDNLQSGPDTGKGLAESLKTSHVVLSNFPSEHGYLATLEANAGALLKAANPMP